MPGIYTSACGTIPAASACWCESFNRTLPTAWCGKGSRALLRNFPRPHTYDLPELGSPRMASAIAFIQWDNYTNGLDGCGFFAADPLTFNSRQERLHLLGVDDRLWLVSRCPEDQQYYFIGVLHIAELRRNPPDSSVACAFGEFAIVAERACSQDLGKKFPAEGLLRAFEFDSRRPIKFG